MTAPIVQQLRDAAQAMGGERVSMQTLVEAHGPEAHGSLMLLLAMPCLLPIPGVGTVLGVGLLALALAMWKGQVAGALPERVAGLELPRDRAQRVLMGLAAAYAVAGRHARERLAHMTSANRRSGIALATGLMAGVIVLPIPFGNVLPAAALVLIGLGMVFRDGMAVLAGLLVSLIAAMATAGLVFLVGFGAREWAAGWI